MCAWWFEVVWCCLMRVFLVLFPESCGFPKLCISWIRSPGTWHDRWIQVYPDDFSAQVTWSFAKRASRGAPELECWWPKRTMLCSGRLITMNSFMAHGQEQQKPKKNKDKNKKDKKVQGLFAGCWHPLAFAGHVLWIARTERRIIPRYRSILVFTFFTCTVCRHAVDNLPSSVAQGNLSAQQDKKEDQGEGCQIAWPSPAGRQGHQQAWVEANWSRSILRLLRPVTLGCQLVWLYKPGMGVVKLHATQSWKSWNICMGLVRNRLSRLWRLKNSLLKWCTHPSHPPFLSRRWPEHARTVMDNIFWQIRPYKETEEVLEVWSQYENDGFSQGWMKNDEDVVPWSFVPLNRFWGYSCCNGVVLSATQVAQTKRCAGCRLCP